MRISEKDVAHLRTGTKARPGGISVRERRNFSFSQSWTFFPLELGEPGDDIVALLAYTEHLPPLNDAFEWLAVEHQSGGYACQHPVFVGVRLFLRPTVHSALRKLAKVYHGYDHGQFGIADKSAKDICEYNSRLGELGLHCNYTYPWLHEAVYPVDATKENLSVLASSPPILDQLGDDFSRRAPGFGVYILAANSD